MVTIVEVRDMPAGLSTDCDSGWEKIEWPEGADTLLCKFDKKDALIVGNNVEGWHVPRGRCGWYLGPKNCEPLDLSVLRARKLYFAEVTDITNKPLSIAKLITRKLRKDKREGK